MEDIIDNDTEFKELYAEWQKTLKLGTEAWSLYNSTDSELRRLDLVKEKAQSDGRFYDETARELKTRLDTYSLGTVNDKG